MALALDSLGSVGFTTALGTLSHTCSGANLILIVGNATDSGGQNTGTVTYAGVNMTLVGTSSENASRSSSIWKLIAPATGANNIIVSTNQSGRSGVFSYSYTGADQTSGVEGSVFGTANNGTAAGTITTVSDNAVLLAVWRGKNAAGGALPSNTLIGSINQSFSYGWAVRYTNAISPAGLGTVGGTHASANWSLSAVSIIPAVGGGGEVASVSWRSLLGVGL